MLLVAWGVVELLKWTWGDKVMRRTPATVGLLLGALLLAAHAAEVPKTLTEATLPKCLERHQAEAQKRLAAAKKGTIRRDARSNVVYFPASGRYMFRSAIDRDAEVTRIEQEMNSPTLPLIWVSRPDSPNRPIDGQIGSLTQNLTTYRVLQVVDEGNAIMVGEAAVLGGSNRYEWSFWLESSKVRGWTDEQAFKKLPGAWKVDGSKRYTTATGTSRTIAKLVEFDLAPHLERARKKLTPPRKR